MPNYLSSLWSAANQPLIPEAPMRRAQEAMTTPHLDESPLWAKTKGFGAGALEGLRNMVTPLGIASLAIPGAEAGEGVEAGVQAARGMSPTMDLLGELPAARQMMPTGGDVDALTGLLKYNLAKVPNAASKAQKGLVAGVHDSQSIRDLANPSAQAQMEKMYQQNRPVAQDLIQKGAFSGSRYTGQ